jgi:hypothetical protein
MNESVTEHIQKLDSQNAEIIEFLRKTILNIDREIAEHIKWNSPSFYYDGEMKAFNPKEYKRDILVMNIHKGNILLVFPTGAKITNAKIKDAINYPDGRKIIKVADLEDAKDKQSSLEIIITEWLGKIEK